jgi:hypothetical protein
VRIDKTRLGPASIQSTKHWTLTEIEASNMARSLAAKGSSQARRPSPSPSPQPQASGAKSKKAAKRKLDYTSEGVEDNDVFLLPVSDYQVMILVTIAAAAVRLFRIYQPTSVVFDEVQCVHLPTMHWFIAQ